MKNCLTSKNINLSESSSISSSPDAFRIAQVNRMKKGRRNASTNARMLCAIVAYRKSLASPATVKRSKMYSSFTLAYSPIR